MLAILSPQKYHQKKLHDQSIGNSNLIYLWKIIEKILIPFFLTCVCGCMHDLNGFFHLDF